MPSLKMTTGIKEYFDATTGHAVSGLLLGKALTGGGREDHACLAHIFLTPSSLVLGYRVRTIRQKPTFLNSPKRIKKS